MARNVDVEVPGSFCYENDESKCEADGRLYTFAAAQEVAAKTPGFRLPLNSEFAALMAAVGGDSSRVRVGGDSGLNFPFAGYRDPNEGEFRRHGKQTGIWTGERHNANTAYKIYFMAESSEFRHHPVMDGYGDSVRLVRDCD